MLKAARLSAQYQGEWHSTEDWVHLPAANEPNPELQRQALDKMAELVRGDD